MEWFYTGLAGIKQADNSVAYNKIEIKPQQVGDVTSAKAIYHSPYGEIVSDWSVRTPSEKKDGDTFELDVEIPVNTTATIYFPVKSKQQVTTGGVLISAKYIDGKAVIKIGSGKYHFKTKQKE
jgi:hypothetical protein